MRMADHALTLSRTFTQFKTVLRSCTMVILQEACLDAMKVMQFSPKAYISFLIN